MSDTSGQPCQKGYHAWLRNLRGDSTPESRASAAAAVSGEQNVNVQCACSMAAAAKLLARGAGRPFFEVVSDDRQMARYRNMLLSTEHITVHEQIRGTHDLYFDTTR